MSIFLNVVIYSALSCAELLKIYELLEDEIESRGCLESDAVFKTAKCKYLVDKVDQVIHQLETRCLVDTFNPRC
jgi:hypothetical protein